MPRTALRLLALLALLLLPAACGDDEETPPANNGAANNGNNGTSNNGVTNNGATNNGVTNNGVTNNGATNNGATNNGATNNGATNNGGNPFDAICASSCAQSVTCGTAADAAACVTACLAGPDLPARACYADHDTCEAIATCVAALTNPDPPTGDCADFDTNEPNDTLAQATPITTATIDFVGLCAGDTDWYSVEVATPNTLLAYLEAIAITTGDPQTDVQFELHDANGLVVASEPIGADAAFDHTPTATGTFYIKVANANATGDGYIYALDYLVFDAGQ